MTANRRILEGWITTMRWVARLLSLLAWGLFVLFVVDAGDTLLPTLTGGSLQGWPMAVVILASLAGLLLAWHWEGAGGLLALLGSLGILALTTLGSGADMLLGALLFAGPLLLAACLYLGCCITRPIQAFVRRLIVAGQARLARL